MRVKYLCKLYEGCAHLLCEPLVFEWAEELLSEAETIYLNNEGLLTELDRAKYRIKKSSFLKKFGFFEEA